MVFPDPDGSGTLLFKSYEPATAIPHADRIPLAIIPTEAAHAVLAELARHLGAVEHPEQLRKDYDAERARVDRLIGIVAEYRA